MGILYVGQMFSAFNCEREAKEVIGEQRQENEEGERGRKGEKKIKKKDGERERNCFHLLEQSPNADNSQNEARSEPVAENATLTTYVSGRS